MSYFIVHRSQVQPPIVIDESFSDILSLLLLHSNWATVTHQCRDAANHVVIKNLPAKRIVVTTATYCYWHILVKIPWTRINSYNHVVYCSMYYPEVLKCMYLCRWLKTVYGKCHLPLLILLIIKLINMLFSNRCSLVLQKYVSMDTGTFSSP